MACIILYYLTAPIMGKLAKNFVSSCKFQIFSSVGRTGKDLVDAMKCVNPN